MRASSRILEKMLDGLVPGATLDRNELDGVKPPRDDRCEAEGAMQGMLWERRPLAGRGVFDEVKRLARGGNRLTFTKAPRPFGGRE